MQAPIPLPRALLAPLVLLALSACGAGGDGLRNLDSELAGPDEFSVLPGLPLTIPDSRALPPPTPGGANRTDQNPAAEAIAALGGNPAAVRAGGIPAQDAALVAFAGRAGTDPAIRQTLAQEDAALRARAGGLSFNILGKDRYYPAYARFALDAYAELARLRAAGIDVPTAPPLR
jgi:hypothetical protein